MAKASAKKVDPASGKITNNPPKPLYIILLIAYGFVTVLTPNLHALDSNGPKFLSLALLNIVTFAFLFTRRDLKSNQGIYSSFFSNIIGVAYSLLMAISLLSFLNAINKPEAILHFAKIFTVFSASYLISVLLLTEKRGLLYLAVSMSFLLIFDSITVFSGIGKFIQGNIPSIGDIQSVYSNKNILTASVFVKIPFALWLMISHRKWARTLGAIALLPGMVATFFMSSRAFYVGMILLTLIVSLYFVIRYFQDRDKAHIKTLGVFLALLVISSLVFSAIPKYFYPKSKDGLAVSIGERMATIPGELAGGIRLSGWKRSWHVFREHPLLGVGIGNWKIATLREENLTKKDYNYLYKAHNDFIETYTETGIFGGIFFISIFVFVWWKFSQLLYKKGESQALHYLLLPVIGLLCYSVDAFFNFPHDRPEMQALFALYIGNAIALTSSSIVNKPGTRNLVPGIALSALLLIILAGSTYILYMNFKSLKLQKIILQEMVDGKLTSSANKFLKGFPPVPTLNALGEPIAVLKSRYLFNEKRYDETIALLESDHSSPYDSRPEYFLAMAYYEKGLPDSVLHYSRKVYEMKPQNFMNIRLLTNTLVHLGKWYEAEQILDKYLAENKKDKEACLFASSFYDQIHSIQKAVAIIDSAAIWFPADTTVLKQRTFIHRSQILLTDTETLDAAMKAFRDKNYQESVTYLSMIIALYPTFTEAIEYRAFSYFFLNEYANSNEDLNLLVASGIHRPDLHNLLGVNHYNLGNQEEACSNFKIALEMGDENALANYNRFCQPGQSNMSPPAIK